MTMKKEPEYIEYEDGTRVELDEDDVPELSAEWFKNAKRFDELPEELQAGLKAITRGRPRVERPKQPVKIRLDADLLAALRSRGKGWQTRVNAALREAVDSGKL